MTYMLGGSLVAWRLARRYKLLLYRVAWTLRFYERVRILMAVLPSSPFLTPFPHTYPTPTTPPATTYLPPHPSVSTLSSNMPLSPTTHLCLPTTTTYPTYIPTIPCHLTNMDYYVCVHLCICVHFVELILFL